MRTILRDHTRAQHDVLDASLDVESLGKCDRYADFLRRQYRARQPVEAYVESLGRDDMPPPAVPRLERDLHVLGVSLPPLGSRFTLPRGSDPIGLAWAIAGSHLGNRAMLAGLDNPALPTDFLADERMIAYWKALRPRLDRPMTPAQARPAILAATAVFAQFQSAFGLSSQSRKAA